MPPPRIQVLLDFPRTELYGEGWAMSKLAGGLQFATRYPANGSVPSGLTQSAPPDGLWKVPGLGIIALKPRYESLGVVNYDDPASDVWRVSEVDLTGNDDGTEAITTYQKAGTYARKRASYTSALIGLLVDVAVEAILLSAYENLKVAWRTKAALKANEGWACQVKPVRVSDDPKSKSYIAFGFGIRYFLGLDLQGIATLYENRGTPDSPIWIKRKEMDVGGGGVDLTKDFTVSCVPIGGRYLVFRFGINRFKARGARLSTYLEQHDFVFDCVQEGGGNYYDAALDQFVVMPPGKLSIALNAAGVDYRFLPYKLRYDTAPVVATFTGEPLNEKLPGQTPTMTPYGYASNDDTALDPKSKTGAGTLTASFTDETGAPWSDDSLEVCPKVTFTASSDGVYTPELWYLEAEIAPVVYTPPYEAYDASLEWRKIRFQRSTKLERSVCTIEFNDDSRFAQIMRRGGPIRILVDDVVVFDGYMSQRINNLTQRFVNNESNGTDMMIRFNVPCGKFESQDGKGVGALIKKLIRRAGFLPENIIVHESTLDSPEGDLLGLRVESFDEPQNLKLYNWDCTIFEAIKDLVDKYSIQGYDRIRVRNIGGDWHVYLPWYGGEPTSPDHVDPALTFYSYSGVAPGDDSDRWEAKLMKITSGLEFDFRNPDFNALELYIPSGGDHSFAEKATISPRASVLGDPTQQDFEGKLNPRIKPTPQVTANTADELCRQARFLYEVTQRECNKLQFQAEWQPFVDCDMECVVVGADLDEMPVSFGVYRIEPFDVEIDRDNAPGVARDWSWTASYTLQWLRPTSDGYPLPMFSTFVPPPSYAASVASTGS